MSGPSPAQLRTLLDEARAVARAADDLAGFATNAEDAAWAHAEADFIRARYARLAAAARAGDARAFPGTVQAVVVQFRALEDAPEALQPAILPVLERMNVLAERLRDIIDPHIGSDGFFPPAVAVAVADALRGVAAE